MISTMKNSIILLVLNLLCLLCYGQVQKGRVYDETTGKGIAGVTITSKSTQKQLRQGRAENLKPEILLPRIPCIFILSDIKTRRFL